MRTILYLCQQIEEEMVRTWFTCKVKYSKLDETGKLSTVTEPYLVDAMTYTEAEARINQEMAEYVRGEFFLKNISQNNYADIFHYDDSDTWYKCKVSYVTIDADNEKEKKISAQMLVTANSIKQAYERLEESLADMMVPYEILAIQVTTLVDIFPYEGGDIPETAEEAFEAAADFDAESDVVEEEVEETEEEIEESTEDEVEEEEAEEA